MRKRQRYLGVVVAVGLIAGACSSGHKPVTSPTTVPPDPYAVPPVITPAYVDKVFVALEHVDGNATRALLSAHAVTPEVVRDLRSIYNDSLFSQEEKIASQDLSENMSNVIMPPGDVEVTVNRLISGSSSCVFVETSANFSAVLQKPQPFSGSTYWGLRRKSPGNDPGQLNPTPWAFFFNASYPTPISVPDQCAS